MRPGRRLLTKVGHRGQTSPSKAMSFVETLCILVVDIGRHHCLHTTLLPTPIQETFGEEISNSLAAQFGFDTDALQYREPDRQSGRCRLAEQANEVAHDIVFLACNQKKGGRIVNQVPVVTQAFPIGPGHISMFVMSPGVFCKQAIYRVNDCFKVIHTSYAYLNHEHKPSSSHPVARLIPARLISPMAISFDMEQIPYHLVPISPADADHLRALGGPTYIADSNPGYPCRQCLRDAEVGETLVLTSHDPFDRISAYRSASPIFLHASPCMTPDQEGMLPLQLTVRELSVRSFDENALMIDAAIIDGGSLDETINRFFTNAESEFIHVHNASRGCWAVTVHPAS